jgi:hypothetical protein
MLCDRCRFEWKRVVSQSGSVVWLRGGKMVNVGRPGTLSPATWAVFCLFAVACQRVPEPHGGDSGDGNDTTSGSTWGTSTASTTSNETSASTTDSSTSTADDATSSDFVMETDVGGPAWCDIFDPDSCPEGEKCTAYSLNGSLWDRNGCLPVMGDKQPHEPCMAFGDYPGVNGLDDCAKGAMCWSVDPGTHEGYCIGFCFGDAGNPTCDPGYVCPIGGDATLPLCRPNCDPVLAGADCPGADETCVALDFGLGELPFTCVREGSGAPGDVCSLGNPWNNDCDPGLFCAAKEDVPGCPMSGCCSEFCDVNAPNTCEGAGQGQVCEPWVYDGMVPPGYEHVGGCGVP